MRTLIGHGRAAWGCFETACYYFNVAKKRIRPAQAFSGVLMVPGDKSISHRYAIVASLAEGRSEIANFSAAADCRSTLNCLRGLGVQIEEKGNGVIIEGKGLAGWKAPRKALDAGNSGTTMRLLAGALAGQDFASELTGDRSLRSRPMRRVIEPLREMGAQISAREGEFAPLEIRGGKLRGIEFMQKIASAQVKSALLLAGLFADGETIVHEPVPTRDHTELILREMGAKIGRRDGAISIQGGPKLVGRPLTVPGDLSAAAFFLCAALIVPDTEMTIQGVGLNPTRTAILDFLASMGAPVSVVALGIREGELVGDVHVKHGPVRGGKVCGAMAARLIDELPVLAALAPFTEEGIEIRDAQELRVKESDRIATVAENLRGMGAQVEEFPDGLRVKGRSGGRLRGATIDPHDDHRIAMAFSIAALGAEGETVIRDADCVEISFPEFFELLEGLVKLGKGN
ncbi:MAG TPA: 3-phosphoshikimate 1-carboxyvinyltransferase [Candidatus Acidoferrales bacterium]|nr:3-phosphoshikimate 1-carboxyvinyltransferase [Candidatus Acidoferrales bacterium]